jgi:putative spermidine/putrescine transport system substrate-binding protein
MINRKREEMTMHDFLEFPTTVWGDDKANRFKIGIGRRTVLVGMASAAAALAGFRPAFGASKDVVVVNWGGLAVDGFKKAWTEPLRKEDNLNLVIDGSGPSAGKIKAMVQANNVVWDVCDGSVGSSFQLGEAGLLEEIDYSIVSKQKVRPEFAYKWSVCNYMFSYVMAVNHAAFNGHGPQTWQDFYDVKKFPGKRTLRGLFEGQLEGALLADGVPPKDLYPLDVPRALAKIKSIKDHIIFWKSGAEADDLFRRNEVVAGNLWSNRANLLRGELTGLDWNWEGAVLAPAVWIVPKNNPAGREPAMKFIAVAQEPRGQVELFKIIRMSPANPEAAALIPPELRRHDATQPDNVAKQIPLNVKWYGENSAQVQAKYLDMMSS